MTECIESGMPLRRRLAVALLPCITTAVCLAWLHNGWAAILAYHAVIVASVTLAGWPDVTWSLRGRWTTQATFICLLSALTGPLLYALLPLMTRGGINIRLASIGLSGTAWILFIPYFALVNPLLEEVFWRGLLRRYPPRTESPESARLPALDRSDLIFDALFAAYHLIVLPLFVTAPFVVIAALLLASTAATWRMVWDRSGGPLPAIVSHALADIGIIVAVALRR